MKKILLLLITIVTTQVNAQDIIGAYIHTKRLPNTNTMTTVYDYSIAVTLFADASQNIARPTIPIAFGDGNTGTFSLSASSSTNGIQEKTYSGTHIYPGAGNYSVNYLDAFRIAGIKNISNSQGQQIRVGSQVTVSSFLAQNSSPVVSVYPLNLSVTGNQVVYAPAVSDADGDSLSFSLMNCYAANYYLPTGAAITGSTGVINFSKDSVGRYAFSFEIKEWRKNTSGNYMNIGSSQVDFVMDITIDVGLKEQKYNALEMKIYPNPVKEKLHPAFENKIEIDKINILNTLGQVVFTQHYSNVVQEIDVSFLPRGIYYMTVQSRQAQAIFKIVKE